MAFQQGWLKYDSGIPNELFSRQKKPRSNTSRTDKDQGLTVQKFSLTWHLTWH